MNTDLVDLTGRSLGGLRGFLPLALVGVGVEEVVPTWGDENAVTIRNSRRIGEVSTSDRLDIQPTWVRSFV